MLPGAPEEPDVTFQEPSVFTHTWPHGLSTLSRHQTKIQTCIFLLHTRLHPAERGKKFPGLERDHLFCLDEEKRKRHSCLQRAELIFPSGASDL